MPVSFVSTGGSCQRLRFRSLLWAVATGTPGGLFSRCQPSPDTFSATSRGISRVSVEPFTVAPCSQTPVEPPRLALTASRCCPPFPRWSRLRRHGTFRDSIAWLDDSLCTLRADITADYATLVSGGWLTLSVSPSQATGFVQPISLFVFQTPPSVTDLSRRD